MMLDNKGQHKNHLKKCHICGIQSPIDGAFTEMAHYAPDTGNLMMVARLACGSCREEILSVRQYVKSNGLVFGKDSLVYDEYISSHLKLEPKDDVWNNGDSKENNIYDKYVEQEVKRNRLYHCKNLPQNCLQLVYYSSYSVSHAERHQRIKNTIITIMKETSIPFGNIDHIAILVHYLTCYMHEDKVISLIKLLYRRNLLEGSPVNPVQLHEQLPAQRIWYCLYEKSYIGNHIAIISYLLEHWKAFQFNLPYLQEERHLIKNKQQLYKALALKSEEVNRKLLALPKEDSEKKRSNTSHSFGTQSQILGFKKNEAKLYKNQNQSKNSNQKGYQKCQNFQFNYLREIQRYKNYYSLILRSLLREDAAMREHVDMMQQKFKKEKEEFINKIIRLKDTIQMYEKNEDTQKRRPRSLSESKIIRVYKPDLEEVSQKSQGTNRTMELPSVTKIEENGMQTTSTEKGQEQSKTIQAKSLHPLVIHIPDFDPSLLSDQTPSQQILDTLQAGIKLMSEKLEQNQKKIRSLESESKRLLTILTRKEERFVPLIHQKDQLIERYQNALWRMERGLAVQDQLLAPRIKTIFQYYKSQILENISNMNQEDLRASLLFEQSPQSVKQIENPKTPSKNQGDKTSDFQSSNEGSKKKKKKTKKVVKQEKEDRDCRIF